MAASGLRSWDHHDLLEVTPLFDSPGDSPGACSTSAYVTSIAPYTGRRSTSVRATDATTGQVLRCEVFVDRIASVRILHRSLKLDLDGLATLEVRAFDEEGENGPPTAQNIIIIILTTHVIRIQIFMFFMEV